MWFRPLFGGCVGVNSTDSRTDRWTKPSTCEQTHHNLCLRGVEFSGVYVVALTRLQHGAVVVFIESQKRPRGAPRMRYGRSVGKALDTFDLDHNKGPELAADRLAWRAMLHIGILLDRKLTREHALRPHRHMGKSRSTTYFFMMAQSRTSS